MKAFIFDDGGTLGGRIAGVVVAENIDAAYLFLVKERKIPDDLTWKKSETIWTTRYYTFNVTLKEVDLSQESYEELGYLE